MRLPACLPVPLPARLPARLPAYPPTCLPAYAYLPASPPACRPPACLATSLPARPPACPPTSLSASLRCMPTRNRNRTGGSFTYCCTSHSQIDVLEVEGEYYGFSGCHRFEVP